MTNSSKILELKSVRKYFGGVHAVDDVSAQVKPGELVGLIGPNGSGKSTLFNVVSGVYKPDSGEIYFQGERIDGLEPYEIFSKGLVRSFQNPRLFFGMNIVENVMLPPRNQKGERLEAAPFQGVWADQEKELATKGLGILERMQLRHVALNPATEISGGQMKLLEMSRSLMGEPKLLLLDEPTAGVAPKLAREIFDTIKKLRNEYGLTFVIVEHRLDVLFDYVERVLAMNQGKIIADGTPDEVAADKGVIAAYLGD